VCDALDGLGVLETKSVAHKPVAHKRVGVPYFHWKVTDCVLARADQGEFGVAS
jgi:hypothetical protein